MQTSLTHRRVRQLDRKRRTRPLRNPLTLTLSPAAGARGPEKGRRVRQARRGSTLMIVIVLLGLLAVLGVLFYTFAAAERSNAEYYANGAKAEEEPGLPADVVMDFALQQLIVGTDPRLKNSALWGSRHSMLANMLGVKNHVIGDLTAFDGTGFNIISDDEDLNGNGMLDPGEDQDGDSMLDPSSGVPKVDQDFDPATIENFPSLSVNSPLSINQSPAANDLIENPNLDSRPQPDVGYTYPDINNLFLAHVGWVRDRNSGSVRRVIIPSFHRPQLNRTGSAGGTAVPEPLWEDRNYNGVLDGGEDLNGNGVLDPDPVDPDPATKYTLDPFKNRSLRPHPGHLYVPPSQQGATKVSRYVYDPATAAAATVFGDGKRVFPFFPMYPGYNPASGGTDVTYAGASPRPADWIGHQGVWSPPAPTGAPATINDYQYDADNDGDGIREGIWLDLDYPVQELSDGTTFLPMFSITVLDQNGLFDLNSHGNIQELLFTYPNTPFATSATQPFGWNTAKVPPRQEFISASNLGMHAGEVNPAWGLTGRPGTGLEVTTGNMGTVFSQYQLFYNNPPNDSSTIMPTTDQQKRKAWQEVANMELAFLKMGRPQINSGSGSLDDLFPGVYGEEHLIAQNLGSAGSRDPRLYPHPGTSVIDDNNDLNEGMVTPPEFDPLTLTWLHVEQPFDALGIGSVLGTNGTDPKALDRRNPPALSNRVRWPRYESYASNGNVFWGYNSGSNNIVSGNLMTFTTMGAGATSNPYGLFDDPSELTLYANDQRDVDDPLGAADAAFLAMSNTDITNLGITSRLQDLVKFNFSTDPSTNLRGEEIRKRFTTNSNDRKSYAVPRQTGTDGRFWEWTDDNGRDLSQINANQQNNVKLRFPPTFGTSGSAIPRYQIYGPSTTPPNSADPFRPAVRFLLQATREDLQVTKQYQQRLSVNQLLIYNNQTNKLEYRELTPHPLDPGATPIVATTVYPPNTDVQREFWARKDRQQMARDVYVLLYTLGQGPDGASANNPTRTGWMTGGNKYTDQQLEQMARFAVNLVDAQDRDNVITRFEYDVDLSNGWNLDDNPYTTTDAGSPTDRAEVWGLERMELTFNEALVIQALQNGPVGSGTDYLSTEHDDSNERHFLALELRNVAPYNVAFSNKENWQIVMTQWEPGDAGYDTSMHPPRERRLSLRRNAGQVPRAGFYTLFSTDRNEPVSSPMVSPSAFQVDASGGSNTAWIAPRNEAVFLPPAGSSGNHIDLVENTATNGSGFRLTDGQATPSVLNTTLGAGAMLQGPTGSNSYVLSDTARDVRFILRRRAHPTRSSPYIASNTVADDAAYERDNPFVEVDRLVFGPMKTFNPMTAGSAPATIEDELDNLVSQERPEPLSAELDPNNAASGPIYNTLDSQAGAENSTVDLTESEFDYWQAHFDRAFTSVGDLLLIPVVGPPPYDNDTSDTDPNPWDDPMTTSMPRDSGYTRYVEQMWLPPTEQYDKPPLPASADNYYRQYAKNALGLFAVPNHPTLGDTDPTNKLDPVDNRWHRVLEFLEVPTRQNRNLGLGSEFDIARVPGRINLNTIRHAEVLGGWIDDERVADLNLVHPDTGTSITASNFPKLLDAFEGTAMPPRDWFVELQRSRDPFDPFWAMQPDEDTNMNGTFEIATEDANGNGVFDRPQELSLPGLPVDAAVEDGRPFRSLSFTQAGNKSVHHTLLRSLPLDINATTPPTSNRHLFEVGTSAEHVSTTANIDPILRQRILSKMWNNTTTRSNSFVVFISAKLFRAHVDSATGAVQVGGPLREYTSGVDVTPELPEYRGVFVVDRSDLEAAGQSGGGGLTSFRPFVKYRKILQE
ncbi:MAG: hypothetical protein SH850_12030 [Planctomycetaceae bacterium]|nr:hypothetical protein [Planctomycetaceae bacterium]